MPEFPDRLSLAEKIDPELLQMLARMPKRQQRQVLLLLMVVMMIWRPRGLIRISRTGVVPRKGVAP